MQNSLVLLESERARFAARDILRDTLDDQMSLMASGRFDNFRGKVDEAFLSAFILDPLFTDLFSEAQEMATRCADTDLGFQQRLKGALFERMAYAFLSSKTDDKNIPLMGEGVFQIARAVNPKNRVDNFGLGQVAIPGVYIPDGYMVDAAGKEPRITSVIECKLASRHKEKVFEQKSRAVSELSKLGVIVSPDPHFIVVSPSFHFLASQVGIDMVYMPVEQDIFEKGFFDDFVYSQYKVGEGKTLASLRQERNNFPRQQEVFKEVL